MTRLLLAVSLLLSPSAFAAVDIGVAAAVRGKVNGTAPGAAGRVVETGQTVYQNDKIVTGPDAKLQILLLDETSFTVGPNSEMTLDEFVYDPATSAGKVSARVQKGNFRFITGKVARKDPENMKVKLAVGTIGIRGTMVAGQASDKEATVVLLGPGLDNNADEKSGAITVGNEKGSVEVDQDGYGVHIVLGEKPGDPFKLDQGALDGILNGVASAPKGDSKDEGGESGSAGEGSGDDTAGGKDNLKDAFAALDSEQGDTNKFASQQFSAPRASTWEDVRGILSGTGRYTGTAPFYNCTGGTCQSTPAGTATLSLFIDFGAKTFGGNSSSIQFGSVDTGTLNVKSYASLTGTASTSLINGSDISGGLDWTGTSLKLLDVGGVTAAAASLDARLFDSTGNATYKGEVTGSR